MWLFGVEMTTSTLRENCPNTEFLLVCIFPHSDWIWRYGISISSLYVLNCFKYFLIYNLRQNISKSDKKDFELYQAFTHKNILDKIAVLTRQKMFDKKDFLNSYWGNCFFNYLWKPRVNPSYPLFWIYVLLSKQNNAIL